LALSIPRDKVAEIKNSVDILEIVSETVILKKAGKNYQGLCPFHAEKTPSFTVNPGKQIFYCFGCGEGGDVLGYLMKREGLSFPEALRSVAKRGGVEVPAAELSPAEKHRLGERERLFSLNGLVMQYFEDKLRSDAGRDARAYLKRRSLSQETIERFHIGFAPEGWDLLARFLLSKRVPAALGEKAGLVRPRKQQSGHYDIFRNRIMFPIWDSGSRVIGFGGRVMDDALPKYLNSPETPVYNKRGSLYGLHFARTESRAAEAIHVVEGYMDLLALHQNGICNAVATLGTSLSREHVRILKGLIGKTGHVILVFDSDNAGIKAAERSVEVFSKEFVDARVLVLPKGHDPDSFLVEFGADAFREAATGALSIVPFLITTAVRRHGLSTEGKVRVVSELAGTLAAVDDGIARSLHIRELAERIGVDEAAIMERVRAAGSDHSGVMGPSAAGGGGSQEKRGNPRGAVRSVTDSRMERRIIAMMFQFSDILPRVKEEGVLDLFEDELLRRIGERILETTPGEGGGGSTAADVISSLGDADLERTAASLAIGEDPWDRAGCEKFIRQFVGNRRGNDRKLLQRIRTAEKAGDYELVMRLLKEKQALAQCK
jgi:DNA primase